MKINSIEYTTLLYIGIALLYCFIVAPVFIVLVIGRMLLIILSSPVVAVINTVKWIKENRRKNV